MIPLNEIQYLKREEIDSNRWDKCIEKADNGLIYAYSFYLDAMCDNWDALVLGDYEAVMPLPWRRKWGIKYLYQVAFVQRLGVFGNCSATTTTAFYKQASRKFLLLHYNVSSFVSLPKASLKEKNNFIIPLQQSYPKIKSAYSKECISNIQKARNRGCSFTNKVRVTDIIEHYRKAYGAKNPNLCEKDYARLYRLLEEAKKENVVHLLGVCNNEEQLIYSAAIFEDSRRFYYVLGAPTNEGREKRATYFFIDCFLKEHANSSRLFDFEGSDIPGVAAFYQKFGPQTEHYYELKIKRLMPF